MVASFLSKPFLFIPYFLFTLCFASFAHDKNQKKLEYEVNVTLKLVQIYVLDKHGNSVMDLTKDDFVLCDDGEEKTITEFEKHELSLMATSWPQRPSSRIKKLVGANRKFFFFFDFAFNSVSGIARAKRTALDFIDKHVRPEDQVGVLTYTAKKGMTLQEYLTTDHPRIRSVIQGIKIENYLGRAGRIDSKWFEKDPVTAALTENVEAEDPRLKKNSLDAEIRSMKVEAFQLSSQISDLALALRDIPGIKNIILFSSGIPNNMLYGGTYILDDTHSRWGNAGLREKFGKMCKELASANCAVYAVNVAPTGTTSLEERDLLGDGALRQLAKDSGGKYFDNINYYEDINKAVQQVTGTFYVLGYDIGEKEDGRFHNIRIKVKRKGCEVFGQKGYFNPRPFSEYSENERLLHIVDLALADDPLFQTPAELSVTALPIMEQGKPGILALAHLPRKLALKALEGSAEALCLLFNEKGDAEAIIPLKISNPDPSKNFYQIALFIPAQSGKAVVRIAICNLKTGDSVRGVQALTLPDAGAASLHLDPPVILTDARVADIQAAPGASIDALYGYDPKEHSVLSGAIPAGMTKLRAALRITSDKPEVEIELTGRLGLVDGGNSVDIPVSILRESTVGPTKKMIIDLEVGELKPGCYTLTLLARKKGDPAAAYTTATLNVE